MSARTRGTWMTGAVVAGVALLSGLATYLLGGTPAAEGGGIALDPTGAPTLVTESRVVLEIPWGTGDSEIWPGTLETPPGIEAILPVAGETFVVIDHPGWHAGARARWITSEGIVERTHLTAPGATLFAPDGGGILYVVAKGANASEQVVSVAGDGSIDATFTVPLNLNSGLVARRDGDIWVQVSGTVADLQAGTLVAEESFVPVTLDGRQVNDVDAAASRVSLWRMGMDGEEYVRTRTSSELGSMVVRQSIAPSGGSPMRIPDRAIPLGVDGSGSLALVVPSGEGMVWRRTLAGWPVASATTAQLIICRFDGTLVARSVIGWPSMLSQMRERAVVAPDGVYVVDATPDGVSLTRVTAVDAP